MKLKQNIRINKSVLMTGVILVAFSMNAQFSEFAFQTEYFNGAKADMKNSEGDALSVDGVRAAASYSIVDPDSGAIAVGFSVERAEFDFDQRNPWNLANRLDSKENVDSINAYIFGEKTMNPDWSMIGGLFIGSSYASDADIGDGFSWATGFGAKYKHSDTLSYIFGVGYISRLEQDDLIIPLLGVEWQINDRLNLDAFLGLELNYDLFGDESSIIGIGVDYELDNFALGKDAMDGVEAAVRPEGGGVYLSFEQALTDNLMLSAKVSFYGEQDFKTYSDDQKISSFKTESTVFYGIGLGMRF